jgi:NTE family protein
MLQALHEHGIVPDLLASTSAGAINAAYVASRPQTAATAKRLGRIWRNLQREDIVPVSVSALVGGLRDRRDDLVPDRGLRQLVRRYIEFDDLADAPLPLHLVAFDLTERREALLCDGPAVDVIAASASIPGVVPRSRWRSGGLIDCGMVNNGPISDAVELGAEKIYVPPTKDPGHPAERVPQTALDAAIYGLSLLNGSRLEADIARYSREVELIVLPAPDAAGVQPTSFEHSTRLMTEARVAARTALAREPIGIHQPLAK